MRHEIFLYLWEDCLIGNPILKKVSYLHVTSHGGKSTNTTSAFVAFELDLRNY